MNKEGQLTKLAEYRQKYSFPLAVAMVPELIKDDFFQSCLENNWATYDELCDVCHFILAGKSEKEIVAVVGFGFSSLFNHACQQIQTKQAKVDILLKLLELDWSKHGLNISIFTDKLFETLLSVNLSLSDWLDIYLVSVPYARSHEQNNLLTKIGNVIDELFGYVGYREWAKYFITDFSFESKPSYSFMGEMYRNRLVVAKLFAKARTWQENWELLDYNLQCTENNENIFLIVKQRLIHDQRSTFSFWFGCLDRVRILGRSVRFEVIVEALLYTCSSVQEAEIIYHRLHYEFLRANIGDLDKAKRYRQQIFYNLCSYFQLQEIEQAIELVIIINKYHVDESKNHFESCLGYLLRLLDNYRLCEDVIVRHPALQKIDRVVERFLLLRQIAQKAENI